MTEISSTRLRTDGRGSTAMPIFPRAMLRRLTVAIAAATSALLSAAIAHAEQMPRMPSELFEITKVWNIHLTFAPEQWRAMEPTGGRGGPFGGGGPTGADRRRGAGGFGPSMLLAPSFIKHGDQDQDGKLSQQEFQVLGEKWFAEWDKEKTGKLTGDQLRAGLTTAIAMPNFGPPGGRGAGGGRGPGLNLQGQEGKRNGLASAMGIEFNYVHADLEFEGQILSDVAVRYKGNGTFMQSRGSLKRSLKIDLNKFVKSQKVGGVSTLNLHNNVTDASWMNEVLSHRLFRDAGVPAPRTAYARVYVTVAGQYDKEYLGLYSLVENVDETFAEERFGTVQGAIFKPVTPNLFSDLGDDWKMYDQTYDPKTNASSTQKQRVIEFSKLVTHSDDAEFAAKLGDYVDLDQFARFMAVTVWLSTVDSILGPGQNYYVYLHPESNKFQFIPWDLDHSFGQFGLMGAQEQREQLSIHRPWQGDKLFLERVYKAEAFKNRYLDQFKELSATVFQPARFHSQVDELAAAIRPAVAEESQDKLARFDQVVRGEPVAPTGFGGPAGPARVERPNQPDAARRGPPEGNPRGGFGGFFQPPKPIKGFVTARSQSVIDQVAGKSQGQTIAGFGGGPPRGGPGAPGAPGGPRGGFGPGTFLGPAITGALDDNNDGDLSREEFVGGFAKWFAAWSADKTAALTDEQLRAGIDKDLSPARGGGPVVFGIGPAGDQPRAADLPVGPPAESAPRDVPQGAAAGPPDGGPGAFRMPAPPLIETLDVNRDGELTGEEITAAAEALKKLDKNNDGELSEEELRPAQLFGPGGRRPGGPGGFGRETQKVLERFDENKDGMLSQQERAKARADLKERRPAGGGGFGRGGGPFGGRGPGGGDAQARKPGKALSPDDVAKYPQAEFYDPHVLRTLFFEFDNKDWEEELEDFHGTDVEVPARLIVEGKSYDNVGVRFRGTSSYGGVPRGQKRSLNVTIDLVNKDQNLLGYRTLNLLNSHTDPSFLRTVLYNRIAREYLPAPAANLVRVVINGESWGVYVNEEQFNKDFVKKWFGDGDGPRWKVPPNFSGAAALVYHGEKPEDYRGLYELKAKDEAQAWRDLIELCKQLKELPDERIEELDKILNLDRALWFLALDNVLIDEDGYFSRGSDYVIYQEPKSKRFHLMPRDSNETFRIGGGGPGGRGGPGGGRGGPRGGAPPGGRATPEQPPAGPDGGDVVIVGSGGGPAAPNQPARESRPALDPLSQIDNDMRPLIRRLLSNPRLKARYLAHVRTIIDEWLDWEKLEPIFEEYRQLIADDVLADTRNLSTFADFFDADIAGAAGGGPFGGPPGIKRFVEERRKFLLAHKELNKPRPTIDSVDRNLSPREAASAKESTSIEIVARVSRDVPVESVFLHYSLQRGAPFEKLEMKTNEAAEAGASDTAYAATIAVRPDSDLYYYVEACADATLATTTFSPAHAEAAPLHYRAPAAPAEPSSKTKIVAVAINELMAVNNRTITDPQGKFADWIELVNAGDQEADLSGMYLTDDKQKPQKWKFPSGTKLAPGNYLIVWADEGGKRAPDLHANFKLSKTGEGVWLIDSDARGNAIVDTVEFSSQRADVAFGRYPDATGQWQPLPPTPGKPNLAK